MLEFPWKTDLNVGGIFIHVNLYLCKTVNRTPLETMREKFRNQ